MDVLAVEQLIDAGDLNGASLLCERLAAERPHDARAILASARILARRHQFDEALARFGMALVWEPGCAEAHYHVGRIHLREGRPDLAAMAFRLAIEHDQSYFGKLRNEGLGVFTEFASGRVVEALQNVSPAADMQAEGGSARLASWPEGLRVTSPEQLAGVIDDYLLERMISNRAPLVRQESRIMTFGSCFAINMGRALTSLGLTVHNTMIPEDVNSTYANRHLLRWVLNGNVDKFTNYFSVSYGDSLREDLRAFLLSSDLAIMTVGVAPCLFHMPTGDFAFTTRKRDRSGFPFLDGQYRLRTTTVEENATNIRAVISDLRALNPDMRVVLTVSPVPLYATDEMDSVMQADCVSKSTMRLAAHQVVSADPGVLYWPSFEIVRWLGGHAEFSMFGTDDGNARHVSAAVVDAIVRAFVRHCGDPTLGAVSAA